MSRNIGWLHFSTQLPRQPGGRHWIESVERMKGGGGVGLRAHNAIGKGVANVSQSQIDVSN